MTIKKIFENTVLVFLGIFLFFVLLECGLRIGGYTFIKKKEAMIRTATAEKKDITIVCIGESTTDGQWPSYLEEYLQQYAPTRSYAVIDKGCAGASSSIILSDLDRMINEYKPDIIISMMGINDWGNTGEAAGRKYTQIEAFVKTLRVYKLFRIMKERFFYLFHQDYERGGLPLLRESVQSEMKARDLFLRMKRSLQYLYVRVRFRHIANLDALDAHIKYYREKKKYELARVLVETGLAQYPDANRLYWHKAQLFIVSDMYPEASKLLEKIILNEPHFPLAYETLAHCYTMFGDNERAFDALKKAIESEPDRVVLYVRLARSAFALNRIESALDALKKAENIDPFFEDIYLERTQYYFMIDEPHQSEALYLKVIKMNPTHRNAMAFSQLAVLYSIAKRYDDIERIGKDLLRYFPDQYSYEIYNILGQNALLQGDFAGAEVYYSKIKEKDIKDAILPDRIIGRKGLVYFEQGEEMIAEYYFERAETRRMQKSSLVLLANYKKLRQIAEKNKIHLVCAQYPVRKLKSLQKMLEYSDDVVFVDNEKNFKDAMRETGYESLFIDNFGGEFGHCTEKGNRLLAENIAKTVARSLLAEKI